MNTYIINSCTHILLFFYNVVVSDAANANAKTKNIFAPKGRDESLKLTLLSMFEKESAAAVKSMMVMKKQKQADHAPLTSTATVAAGAIQQRKLQEEETSAGEGEGEEEYTEYLGEGGESGDSAYFADDVLGTDKTHSFYRWELYATPSAPTRSPTFAAGTVHLFICIYACDQHAYHCLLFDYHHIRRTNA